MYERIKSYLMGKYVKKCPNCELNYVEEGEELCRFCKADEKIKNGKIKEAKLTGREEALLQEKYKLLETLLKFGFDGFYHTTNLSNFLKIYKSGVLAPRQYLLDHGIDFEDNAEHDIIDKTNYLVKNCVRFYFRPITPTNISAFMNHNQKNPVLIEFDKKLMFNDMVYFSQGGAASNSSQLTAYIKDVRKFKWKDILREGSFNQNDIVIKNLRNSEFLVRGLVSMSMAKKIFFRCQEDMDEVVEKLGFDSRFKVDNTKFYQ